MNTRVQPQSGLSLRRKLYVVAALIGLGCVTSYGLSKAGATSLAAHGSSRRAATAPDEDSSGPGRSVPRGSTRQTELRAGLAQRIGDLGSELQTTFENRPSRQQYDDCMSSGKRCDALLHKGMSYALGEFHERHLARGRSELERWIAQSGSTAVAAALGQIVASSTSEFERVVALLLLVSDPAMPDQDQLHPLPAGAYRGLADRGPTEIMMLAARENGPTRLPAESAREFVPLAESPLSSVRRAVFTTLGHREHAAALHDALALAKFDRSHLFEAAMAVSNCGLACRDSLELLLQTGTKEARVALYEAIAFAPEDDREQLVARLRAASADVQGEERELRDNLLREALGEEGAP